MTFDRLNKYYTHSAYENYNLSDVDRKYAVGAIASRIVGDVYRPNAYQQATALAYLILFDDSSIPVKCEP